MTMQPYSVLATDYDGTFARHGTATSATRDAVTRFRAAGGVPVLVTGREIPDLQRVFDGLHLFDLVVAENGALLYWPDTRREQLLGDPPESSLVEALRARHVSPLSIGRVVIATYEPHETDALEIIRDLGLDRRVIFNKGAVMILPSGVDKATGFAAALREVGRSASAAIGVGDAENDHVLLQHCGLGAAVQNAVPSLKACADLVLDRAHGAGVEELIDRMIDGSLTHVPRRERGGSLDPAQAFRRDSHGSPLD